MTIIFDPVTPHLETDPKEIIRNTEIFTPRCLSSLTCTSVGKIKKSADTASGISISVINSHVMKPLWWVTENICTMMLRGKPGHKFTCN